jgi:hypothetical protein
LVLRSIAYRDKKVVGDIRFSCAAVRSRMRCRRSQVRGLAPIVLVSGQDSAVTWCRWYFLLLPQASIGPITFETAAASAGGVP